MCACMYLSGRNVHRSSLAQQTRNSFSALTVPLFEEAMKQAGISIEREVLPNGLALVAEHMPHMRSVAIGIWVRAGSRGEPAGLNGIAHFIEHMVFKGTSRRSAEQIAREMDSVVGLLDAFTSKDMVSFNAKVRSEEHTSELQSQFHLVCRLLLEKKKKKKNK